MNNGKRPSLNEVAQAAGFSRSLVAAILSGTTDSTIGYSAATRDKVLAVARRLGYQRNRTARWLRQGRHGALGVVAETLHVIPVKVLDSMLYTARERGLFLVQDRTPHGEMPMFLKEDSVDGLICFDVLNSACQARLDALELPVVWVNTNRRRGANVITYDERQAAREAALHLCERGWQRLAVITRPFTHYSTAERIAGLQSVAPTAPVLYTQAEPWDGDLAYQRLVAGIEAFLRRHTRLNGFLVTNAMIVPAVYEALERVGKRAGHDAGVVTFDWQDLSALYRPTATVMVTNPYEIGARAVEMIETLIAGGQVQRHVARYELVARESTGGTTQN